MVANLGNINGFFHAPDYLFVISCSGGFNLFNFVAQHDADSCGRNADAGSLPNVFLRWRPDSLADYAIRES